MSLLNHPIVLKVLSKRGLIEFFFRHLHLHTDASFLDGMCDLPSLIERLKEIGHDACAVTDHGNMSNALGAYTTFTPNGIKPIIGLEFYVTTDMSLQQKVVIEERVEATGDDSYRDTAHLVVLAKNFEGYQNLSRLISIANQEGFYGKPRIDLELLKQYKEGLIVIEGHVGTLVAKAIEKKLYPVGETEEEKENYIKQQDFRLDAMLRYYTKHFGDDFYLEIQNHRLRIEDETTPYVIELAKKFNAKLVMTNDAHYVWKTDADIHRAHMSNGIGKSYEEFMGGDFEGFSTCDEFYVKSTEEMLEVALEIGEEAVEALLNTQEIIDKCNVEIPYITMTGVEEKKGKLVGKWKTKEYLFPKFPIPAPFADAKNYFIHLSREGLKKRKEANQLDLINHAEHEYDERLEYEMEVINGMGFPEYFLVLEDVIKFCMEKHIPVGKGRGSGAGSLVAYSLRITDVDPLQFDLLFERFLNPSRISMPDIDIDFCMDRVTEVYEYVIEKYGADHVCKIGTFGTLSAKASIKDLARVFKYDFQKINSFTRQITEIGITIDKILETYEDIKREYETDELFKKIVDYAKRLEGMVRHTSKHASGLIISPFPITDLIPIRGKGIDTSSQYDMHYLELLGLVKLDILKLRTLTVIKRAVDSIRENEGIDIDIDSIDFEDDRVFEQFRQGNTKCIFQFESQGMQSLLKQQQPKSIEDLSAVNSLNIILGEI